jgi:hypothetical protein
MKKIILASLALLCGLVSFSQGKHTETRSITENGITKSWKITKEFDAQGNMIDYDSTYVEGPQNESQMDAFERDFPNDSFGDFEGFGDMGDFGSNDFGSMNMDSIMTDLNAKISQMMQEMQQMMNNMDFDKMFEDMPEMDEFSPQPREDKIIVPDNQYGNKPKGTRA